MDPGDGQIWQLLCSLKKILAGETLDVYNDGKMRRDFTYIDDIVSGVMSCLSSPPKVTMIGYHMRFIILETVGARSSWMLSVLLRKS